MKSTWTYIRRLGMNKRFLLGAFILCLSLVMMYSTTMAQNPRIGTAAATELLIPTGGRDFAMEELR